MRDRVYYFIHMEHEHDLCIGIETGVVFSAPIDLINEKDVLRVRRIMD